MLESQDWEKRGPKPLFDDDDEDELYDDEEGGRVHPALRVVAWVSVLVLLFPVG